MGSGLSHNHRSSVSPQQQPSSARVIGADGSLTEFPASSLVSVSDVLGDNAGRRFFVCSSDALYFDEDVPALGGGELLRPGQIYFVLPAAMLGRPLSSTDMAAMAVRASEAIATARARPARGLRKARVAPVHSETGFGDILDGAVNEKLNERTLGEDSDRFRQSDEKWQEVGCGGISAGEEGDHAAGHHPRGRRVTEMA